MRHARRQSISNTTDAHQRRDTATAGYFPSLSRIALPASDLFPLHNPAPTSGPRPATPGTTTR